MACGLHNCDEPCHNYCKSCPNVIWDEVRCNCGTQVLYPPQPCNTKVPTCDRPCARVHSCGHPATHLCHEETQCPPCTQFVSKMCFGGHEMRKSIPCYQQSVSCGRFCLRPLPCGMHQCHKLCHDGPCPPCTSKCTSIRVDCGHACNLPCHQVPSPNSEPLEAQISTAVSLGKCPNSVCKELLKVFCKCELIVEQQECQFVNDKQMRAQLMDDIVKRYRAFNTEMGLDEIKQMVEYSIAHQLNCDEKCAKEKRSKELADAFGVDKPETSSSLKYSEYLKKEALNNPTFILDVHNKLVNLINNYKKVKRKEKYHFIESTIDTFTAK